MRRVFLILITVIALGIALAGVALANAGPHGSYSVLEDKCASCHRAHTGGYRLTAGSATSVYTICASCHDGTASFVDVLDGALLAGWGGANSGNKLLGGGFEYLNGTAVGSSHAVSGDLSKGDPTKAWGFLIKPGSSQALGYTLSCGSCHDPHGNTNYVMLRKSINQATGETNVSVNPTRGQTLPVDDVTNRSIRWTSESYGGGGTYTSNSMAFNGITGFCGACHTGYMADTVNSGSGNAPGGVYTHRIDMNWNQSNTGNTITFRSDNLGPETAPVAGGVTIPLADFTAGSGAGTSQGGSGSKVTCLSCHFAHGSTATMSGAAANLGYNNNSASLLRVNNRGVCQGCHYKTGN